MIIEFKGNIPSKKNSKQVFCRGGRPTVIPSKAYNSWHKEMMDELKDVPSLKGGGYIFTYRFHIPFNKDGSISKRPFDFSNKIESINDLLVDLNIIEDDNYTIINEQHIYSEYTQYGKGKVILEIK